MRSRESRSHDPHSVRGERVKPGYVTARENIPIKDETPCRTCPGICSPSTLPHFAVKKAGQLNTMADYLDKKYG